NCWYVSCVSPSEWHSQSERTSRSRKTKAFKNESEAKRFAKSMLSEGFEVTAGTLNPHLPKRVITASEIDQWVNEAHAAHWENEARYSPADVAFHCRDYAKHLRTIAECLRMDMLERDFPKYGS